MENTMVDKSKVKQLYLLGVFGALLTFVGDFILGYGVEDTTLTGINMMMSSLTNASEISLCLAAVLGLIGISLEGLSYFSIYGLIKPNNERLAHSYRTGIIGYLVFGPCGFHVPVCAIGFLAKNGICGEILIKYMTYFVLPSFVLFWISFVLLEVSQIKAFSKGYTPYPKWCWIFCLPIGMLMAIATNVFGNHSWVNALSCAWISVGNLWMYIGLLFNLKKARFNYAI